MVAQEHHGNLVTFQIETLAANTIARSTALTHETRMAVNTAASVHGGLLRKFTCTRAVAHQLLGWFVVAGQMAVGDETNAEAVACAGAATVIRAALDA